MNHLGDPYVEEDNTELHVKCGGNVEWIQLAQDRGQYESGNEISGSA
jgi:hypothetical protein